MTTVAAATPAQWRAWLAGHSRSETEVWLIIQHKDSPTPSVRYPEAVEQALCYGWIDSHARTHDADSSLLRFSPRTPASRWSEVNRRRVADLTARGLMTEPGQAVVDAAKAKGTWDVLATGGTSAVPEDLREQLGRDSAASANFERFPPSSKRLILEWIAAAKKPDTRRRRIDRTVALAARNLRANHPATAAR